MSKNIILIAALIILAFIGGWIGGCQMNQPTVTPVDEGTYHGIVVKPAHIAAVEMAAGVIAQIDVTLHIPAQHEWAKERRGNGLDYGSNSGILGRVVRGENDTAAMDAETSSANTGDIGFKTYDFVSRGGGWFTSLGEIHHNGLNLNLIIQELANGDVKILTDEPDVTFSVKQAVRVKQSSWIRAGVSAGYDSKGNLSGNGDLLLWQHINLSGGVRTDSAWQVKGGWMW